MRTGILIGAVAIASTYAFDVTIDVNTSQDRHPISPMIYGTNQTLSGGENFSAFRMGGNRLTGYNWENNASNAGSDWQQSSDGYLSSSNVPGAAVTQFHDRSVTEKAYSIITLQLAGYVAADKNGTVSTAEAAPSARWRAVRFAKGSAFSLTPDVNDGYVYMDEFVNFLVNKYGLAASTTGVRGYDMDNEPDLWQDTHPRLHPAHVRCDELVNQTAACATAVKAVDPGAETFGFVSYGFNGYLSLQDAPDWSAVKGSYAWFIDYYLAEMKKKSDAAGKRLLDVIDLHWYPEAMGDTRITTGGTSAADVEARVQAPRSLWDSTYLENSWIGQWGSDFLPLLPSVKKSIGARYPGTKVAITEYNYGAGGHISGGIAQADVLGVFGRDDVYAATMWLLDNGVSYFSAAFKLYRNYDGSKATFGDTSVRASTSDKVKSSAYAAASSADGSLLHVIAINKTAESMNAHVAVQSGTNYTSATVYGFDATSATVSKRSDVTSISGNAFTYAMPARSAFHFVLKGNGGSTALTDAPRTSREPARILVTGAGSVIHLNASAGAVAAQRIDLLGTDGRVVYSRSIDRGSDGAVSIHGPALPPGVYGLRVAGNGGSVAGRLVVR